VLTTANAAVINGLTCLPKHQRLQIQFKSNQNQIQVCLDLISRQTEV
jgi:hypothetical protein